MPQSRYFTRSQGSVPNPDGSSSSSSSAAIAAAATTSSSTTTASSSSSSAQRARTSSRASSRASSILPHHPVTPRRRKYDPIYTTATPNTRTGSARRSQRFLTLNSLSTTPRSVFTSPRARTRRTSPHSSPISRAGLRSTPARRRSHFLHMGPTASTSEGGNHRFLSGPLHHAISPPHHRPSHTTTRGRLINPNDPPSLLDLARDAGSDLDMDDLDDLDPDDSIATGARSRRAPAPSSPSSRPSRFTTASGVRDEMSQYAEANMRLYHHRLTSPTRRQQDLGRAGPRGGHHIISPTLRPRQERRYVLGEAGALEDLPPLDLSVGFDGDPRDVANPLITNDTFNTPIPPSRPFLPFPYRILDAPKLVDDFYLNLIDWSSTNLIAVALGSMVFIWKGAYGDVTILCDVSKEEELTIGGHAAGSGGGGGDATLDRQPTPTTASSSSAQDPLTMPQTPNRRRRRPEGLPRPSASATRDDSVTCVSWIKSGTHLAVGTKKGWILLYDVRRGRLVQRIPAHWDRVTCLDWTGPVLSSGSKDCSISHRDVRIPSSPSSPRVGEANRLERAHSSEVCRIKWASNPAHFAPRRPVLPDAPNGLWASGGNDNIVRIWDNRMARTPLHNLSHHRGAIKALGWSPHERHVLASAGGAKDQKLCIWSTATARLLAETPTGSQVCDLVWSPFNNELCTAQGYRDSSLRVWRYDGHNLHNMACLETSAKRVIYLTLAPDGESVLSGSPDFMLRLWKVFDSRDARRPDPPVPAGQGNRRGVLNVTTGRYPVVSTNSHVR